MSVACKPGDPDNLRGKGKRHLRPCLSDPGAPSVHALAGDLTELDMSARENMEQDEGIPLQESTRAKQQHQRRHNAKPQATLRNRLTTLTSQNLPVARADRTM